MSSFFALVPAYAPDEPTYFERDLIEAVNQGNVGRVKEKMDVLAKDIASRTKGKDSLFDATLASVVSLMRHKQTPDPKCMMEFMNTYWSDIMDHASANNIMLLQLRVERWSQELPKIEGLASTADRLYLEGIRKSLTPSEYISRTLTEIGRHRERYLADPSALRNLFFFEYESLTGRTAKLRLTDRFPEAKPGDIWAEILSRPNAEVLEGGLLEKINDIIPLRPQDFTHLDKTARHNLNLKLGALEDEVMRRMQDPEAQVPALQRQLNLLNTCDIPMPKERSSNWFIRGCGWTWNKFWSLIPRVP